MAKVRYKELSPEMEKLAAPNMNHTGRPSVGRDSEVSEYYHISIDKLIPYKKQARVSFDEDELEQLAETIRIHGIRQPLSIISSTDNVGFYEVISGERRMRAARIAGLEVIPCIMIKETEHAEELALIENIQRSDLHPVELGEAYSNILENTKRGGMSDLAKKIGKPASSVSERTQLAKLPPEIKTHLISNNIRSKSIFRKLCSCETLVEMERILGLIRQTRNPDLKKLITVSLDDGRFSISAGKVALLNENERNELKITLNEFMNSL